MRRYLFVPAVFAALAMFTVAAGAAWLSSGTDTSSLRGSNLGKPTSVSASATSSTTVQITWQPPAGPSPAPTSYDVFRYQGPTGTKICSAVSSASPRQCTDDGRTAGTTYGYTVEARLGDNWLSGQTAQAEATTDVPSTPDTAAPSRG